MRMEREVSKGKVLYGRTSQGQWRRRSAQDHESQSIGDQPLWASDEESSAQSVSKTNSTAAEAAAATEVKTTTSDKVQAIPDVDTEVKTHAQHKGDQSEAAETSNDLQHQHHPARGGQATTDEDAASSQLRLSRRADLYDEMHRYSIPGAYFVQPSQSHVPSPNIRVGPDDDNDNSNNVNDANVVGSHDHTDTTTDDSGGDVEAVTVPAQTVLGPTRQERLRIIQFLRDSWSHQSDQAVAVVDETDQPVVQGTIVSGSPNQNKDGGSRTTRRCYRLWLPLLLCIVVISVVVGIVIGTRNNGSAGDATENPGTGPPPPSINATECFSDRSQLNNAIDEYLSDGGPNTSVAITYGWPIGTWCTSSITDFSLAFSSKRNPLAASFNESLAGWDTSSARSMNEMFYAAASFNQNISSWSTSKVLSMDYMFAETSFNQDISQWDVSSVTTMSYMFSKAASFNQVVSSWDVSNVENFEATFFNALSFNQALNSWDVSRVTNMKQMFAGTRDFNQNISSWNTSQVTMMQETFSPTASFNQDLSSWDVSMVIDMASLFNAARAFNGSLYAWDTSRVQDMSSMFELAAVFNQDLSLWDVSSVTTMNRMFADATAFNQDVSMWNVSAVESCQSMFADATSFNQDLCSWGASLAANNALVESMFENSACPSNEMEVDLQSSPSGPFCRECTNL